MFIRHDADFADFLTSQISAPKTQQACIHMGAETRVETPLGWCDARDLTAGDRVASLDGGFVEIRSIRPVQSKERAIRIPGGTLGACTDLLVPAEARIALTPPPGLSLTDAPYVSTKAQHLVGYKGIRPTLFGHHKALAIEFDGEEMIWAQTGMLFHATSDAPGFYKTLNYGDTRAVLALADHTGYGPDLGRAA